MCVSLWVHSRGTGLIITGGRSCYQCASSSVTPGQSILPPLCSRRLSSRSIPELSCTHKYCRKPDLRVLPLAPPGLCELSYKRSTCTTYIMMHICHVGKSRNTKCVGEKCQSSMVAHKKSSYL